MSFIYILFLVFGCVLYGGIVESRHQTLLRGCNAVIRIQPTTNFIGFFEKESREKLHIKVSMKDENTEKGCGRNTYNLVSSYKKCGVEKVVPLLPAIPHMQDQYIKNLSNKVTSKGGTDYIFDGGTAVRYPTKQLPPYWFQEYTITGWVFVEEHHERQYLFSWSDGDTTRHDNTGFYFTRHEDSNHVVFGFHHTHNDVVAGNKCLVKKKWRIHQDVIKWNFIFLMYSNCDVQLYVNDNYLTSVPGPLHFHLPEKHIQPKFVIGARWAGSVQKYADYLHGRISGFVLNANEVIDRRKLNCLVKCQEQLIMSSLLPAGFQKVESNQHLLLEGIGNQKDYERVLHDIVYINTDEFPEIEERIVEFEIKNLDSETQIKKELKVNILRKPAEINILGICTGQRDNVFTKQGVRLCKDIKIVMSGCTQTIDSLVVNTEPALTSREKLFITGAYLKRHQLNLVNTETGFVVHGVASVYHYIELLHHIKYAHTGFLVEQLPRSVSITASSRNGLIKSNIFLINFITSEQGLVVISNELDTPNAGVHFVNSMYPAGSHGNRLPGKILATKTNKTQHHYVVWLVVGCVFSSFVVLFMIVYGFQRHRYRKNNDPLMKAYLEKRESTPTEYSWDGEGLPMRLTINPSERVSTTDDPYADIILKQNACEESTTDGSVYSDDDDVTNCDNDSIRQLEWDSLENSIDSILEEDKQSKKSDVNMNREVYL